MINNISRGPSSGFTLELSYECKLSTPLRALKEAGIAKIMEEGQQPIQGHSGMSIMGRGRAKCRPTSPLHCDISKTSDAAPSSTSSHKVDEDADEPTPLHQDEGPTRKETKPTSGEVNGTPRDTQGVHA